jgi:uncharacterized protein (TIGR02246 family)
MTRRSLPSLLTIAALGLLLPAVAAAQDSGKIKQEIAKLNKQFIDYMMKRDVKGLGSLYFDDALLQFQGAPTVEGRSNIEAYWAAGMEGGVQSVEVRSDKIVPLAADVAMQVGTYTITVPGADGAAPTVINGKYGAVYQRRAGQWKVILDTGSE